MKLTPRAQGKRFRRKAWKPGAFMDIRRVGKGFIKRVEAYNEMGYFVSFATTEDETDWERVIKGNP